MGCLAEGSAVASATRFNRADAWALAGVVLGLVGAIERVSVRLELAALCGVQWWRSGSSLGYVVRVLQPGETIQYQRKIVNDWRWYILCAVFTFTAYGLFAVRDDIGGDDGKAIFGFTDIFLIALALWSFARASSREVTVTDRRIIDKKGVIARHVRELPIANIDTVEVRQSTFGRIFGFGSIIIRSVGGGRFPLHGISKPIILRQHIPDRSYSQSASTA